MSFFADDDVEGTWIAFVDTLFNAMFVFAVMFALQSMLPHLKAEAENKVAGITPGRMCAMLSWPATSTADIDLWGRTPGGTVVGYSARASDEMDLLRDDLGHDGEKTGVNFEMMCSKVLKKGTWTFNAHFFGAHKPDDKDVPLTIRITFPIGDQNVMKQEDLTATGMLHGYGDETTMIDFELDEHGQVVPHTQNNVFQPIRDQK